MSIVSMHRLVLPSALTLTIAHRRGGRDRGLEADARPRGRGADAVAAIERRRPVHARGERVEHALDRRILHDRAGRLRAAFAQDVAAAEFDRVDAELARDQIGVALIGPDELRNAEAAQRARRRAVGVELERIDAHVLDVVRPRRGEARFLRDARADIGIGAAVPPDVAFARDDAAVLGHAALDAERRGMLGDDVELLLHGERDLHRPAHDQRQRRHQRLELDVDLGAEAAAEERHLHAHARLRPAEQARDLDAHEGRRLRRGVDDERPARPARRPRRTARAARAWTCWVLKRVLEHMIGRRHGGRGVAAAQLIVERDVGVPCGRRDA